MDQQLVIYETSTGRCPFSEWIEGLNDRKARAIIRARLNRVQLGNFGDCKGIGDGVFELRIPFGPGYRVYFGRDGDRLVTLLCGGDKGSQDRDIRYAKRLWEDYTNATQKL
ncbi:MAG: type II toxin-antitoxin system RelE/ParE family toxin [Deltaproteobacteria bacterium]|nr:type II toxin-antitoxin system RelE/ParE family toxin [Deltaproteobacteria bacterium]